MATKQAIAAAWRLWLCAAMRPPVGWGRPPFVGGVWGPGLDDAVTESVMRWGPVDEWAEALAAVDDEDMRAASVEIARSLTTWPTIGHAAQVSRRVEAVRLRGPIRQVLAFERPGLAEWARGGGR